MPGTRPKTYVIFLLFFIRTITLLVLLTKKQAHKGEVIKACKPEHESKSI